MNIKQILPIEVNYKIRHLFEFARQITPVVDEELLASDKRVFFLDAPSYGNIGDQAIAYAMEKYISDVLPDYTQIEITEDKVPASIKWLKRTIRGNDLICLTGGGNMGVTYQRYESVRRLIMRSFPNNPIVVFPQTVDYENSTYGRKELKRAIQVYEGVRKLVLCARDEESYQILKKSFSKAEVLFCPDIVLYLDYSNCFEKGKNTGICLRNDVERVLSDSQHKLLHNRYPDAGLLTTSYETADEINSKNRKEIVEKKLKEFGENKLVLSDRLHGVIFAYVTGVPCIAFPNSNGKVERVCKYLSKSGNVVFSEKVDTCNIVEDKINASLKKDFDGVKTAIDNAVNYIGEK